jgi:uncharacterized YccA/Bax inhibitor family protein
MSTRGRPILGGFAGLLFGLSLALALLVFGIVALDSILLVVAPILGVIVGVLLAFVAPFGSRQQAAG